MKRNRIFLLLASIWIFAVSGPFLSARADDSGVGFYESFERINEHNQLPLDPYPPFGLLTGYICYPNQFYGSKQFQVTQRKLRLLVAENEFLKIAMCPDYGGRLYYMFDKVRNREVIHRINTDAKFYNAGMGYQYVGGGLELNLPNAHSQTNARPRECAARRNPDGSVSLIMSNTERIGRIHWTVSFTLSPGEARIRQDVRVANETAVEARYLYWANCGIPLKDDTEFIFPESKGAMHGKYDVVFSWPVYENANIALIKNLDEMLGLYMLDAREGFFGYFSHEDRAGLAHYADVNDVPGKKYWSWGWHETARHTKFTHTDGQPYGEVQSGRIVIQEKFDRLLPMASQTWTEFWYPVGDIGVFSGASADAAAAFSVKRTSGDAAVAEIRIQAARPFKNVTVSLKNGAATVKSVKVPALDPGQPAVLTADFACSDADLEKISLDIARDDGRRIAEVWSKAKKPRPFDSYSIPEKKSAAKAEDFSVEGLFSKAEALATDWFYHLPRQKKILGECLKLDPGYSRAHGELGLIAFQAGKFEKALGHFERALQRIPDDGRILYYKGLCLRFLGRIEDARYFLRHSGRFGYECPERIAEAEMAIAEGDLPEADRHLARAIEVNGSVLKGFLLRALVLNRLGRTADSAVMIRRAASLDPESAFVSCARMLVGAGDPSLAGRIRARYADFPEEILEVTAALYSAGLYAEASKVLNLSENDAGLARLYRAELDALAGRKEGVASKGKSAGGDFAWRLEEYLMLRNRIQAQPVNAELYYHLGNFAYAHDLEEEGVALWEKAYGLGHKDKVSLYSLYRAGKKLGPADEKAFGYLTEALALDKNDPYLFDAYAAEIRARKGVEESIRLLEDNIGRFLNCFTTCGTLMNAYLRTGAYDKLEAFIPRMILKDYWRSSLGADWMIMKMATGYRKLGDKKYREALTDFEAAARVPENLEAHFLPEFSQQARRLFYIGYCRSKLGDGEGAKKAWEEALGIRRHVRFEASYNFALMNARYFQAFCLRGLGRNMEADIYVRSIREFADSSAIAGATDQTRRHLLNLAFLGQEKELDLFSRFDTELGITTFAGMATSVED